jgi:uncharacterized FlgJ-related protein
VGIPKIYKKGSMSYEGIIYTECIRNGMPVNLAFLIVAQAKHETANFTSNVFKSCNNAFGYKYVGQALATGSCNAARDGGVFAKYASIKDSTTEICLWIKRRQKEGKFPKDLTTIKTAEQYATLLKQSTYYMEPISEYAGGILRWLKDKIIVTNALGFVVGLAILFFCFLTKGDVFEFP